MAEGGLFRHMVELQSESAQWQFEWGKAIILCAIERSPQFRIQNCGLLSESKRQNTFDLIVISNRKPCPAPILQRRAAEAPDKNCGKFALIFVAYLCCDLRHS